MSQLRFVFVLYIYIYVNDIYIYIYGMIICVAAKYVEDTILECTEKR